MILHYCVTLKKLLYAFNEGGMRNTYSDQLDQLVGVPSLLAGFLVWRITFVPTTLIRVARWSSFLS